jgi:hypothetical protein
MKKIKKNLTRHIILLAFLTIPLIYSPLINWEYRNIDEAHCGVGNLKYDLDYDVELCQINGTNLVFHRDGSDAILNIKFTYPQDVITLQEDLAAGKDTLDSYEWSELVYDMYNFHSWSIPFEESLYMIGQFDLDAQVEIIGASHPALTYPGAHGSEVIQLNNYGKVNDEESIGTQLFMSYITQFSGWWSYVGLFLYGLAVLFCKSFKAIRKRSK